MGNPSISVIVVCYNNLNVLKVVLPRWVDMEYDNYEVIVVDDGSPVDSGIKEYVESLGFKYLYNDSGTLFALPEARNLGVWHAKNEYIVFSDGDMLPHRHHLLHHGNALNEHVISVGRRYYIDGDKDTVISLLSKSTDTIIDYEYILLNGGRDVLPIRVDERIGGHFPRLITGREMPWNWIFGANYGVKRSHIIDVGGFNEDFNGCWGGDDQEIQYRLYVRFKLKPVITMSIGYHIPHNRAANTGINAVKLRDTIARCDYRNPSVPKSWVGFDPSKHYL